MLAANATGGDAAKSPEMVGVSRVTRSAVAMHFSMTAQMQSS